MRAMLLRRVAFTDFWEPCLPSPAAKPPAGAGWVHEIKHDGFRMIVRRNLTQRTLPTFRPTPAQLTDQAHQLGVALGMALASLTLARFTG
jgi:hypothetical protein